MGNPVELTTTRQKVVTTGYTKVGTIDSRMWAALAELRPLGGEETSKVKEENLRRRAVGLEAEEKSDQLHWRMAEDLRELQGATQFVGANLHNAHPGYTTLTSSKEHRQALGFKRKVNNETTVVWMEGIDTK